MADKAIFLDRDNTIIEDPGYISDPDQVKLLDGAAEALNKLSAMGYKLIVVSNQSGVARGIVTEKTLEQIHQKLRQLLAEKNAYLDKIYYCPYHPEGVIEKYRRESDLRKPNPGMILAAAKDMDIDLDRSWAIGNSYRDILAGQRAGCKTILIDAAVDQTYRRPTDPVPDKQAVNLKEAVNIIKMYDRKNRLAEAVSSQEKIEPAFEAEGLDNHTETIQHGQNQQKRQPVEVPMKVKHEEAESTRTNRLLEEMLRHIKEMQREGMFEEFSLAKVVAGIVQALVLLCLFLSLLFLTDHTKSASSVHTMIGYAIVLQLMVIAFYMMRDRK